MCRLGPRTSAVTLVFLVACSAGPEAIMPPPDSGAISQPDARAVDAKEAASDAGLGDGCAVSGAPGQCLTLAACAMLTDHASFPGHCPGPSTIQCCIKTPSTADNPPIPTGWKSMAQSQVTPEMTTWAVSVLHDPTTYPMFAVTQKTFGALTVLARVEWHPPDFQNGVVHRGVTLYVPV